MSSTASHTCLRSLFQLPGVILRAGVREDGNTIVFAAGLPIQREGEWSAPHPGRWERPVPHSPARKKTPLAAVTPLGNKNNRNIGWRLAWGQPPARLSPHRCLWVLLLHPVKRSECSNVLCKCYSGPQNCL